MVTRERRCCGLFLGLSDSLRFRFICEWFRDADLRKIPRMRTFEYRFHFAMTLGLLLSGQSQACEPPPGFVNPTRPEIAPLEWPGPDAEGQPFVKGSTALHYAANDGKLALMRRLIECGADVNASGACWFRSVLSWAANNARFESIRFLLEQGARPDSLDALHAAREDIVVVKVDINRPEHKGIDWKSPVAQQYKMQSIPYFKVYGPDGKLVADGKEASALVRGMLE